MASQKDNKKVVMTAVAIAALALAGLLLYWNFAGEAEQPAPPDITSGMSDAEKKEFEKNQADKQQLMKRTPPAGA
jgi:hypothetical protein